MPLSLSTKSAGCGNCKPWRSTCPVLNFVAIIQQVSELQMEEFGDMALVPKGIARVGTVNSYYRDLQSNHPRLSLRTSLVHSHCSL